MARERNKLTKRDVDNPRPGWAGDGGGLWLRTDADGASSRSRWIFKYTRAGRTVELGLGSAQDVTLTLARELAERHRKTLAEGGDPKAEKRKAVTTAQNCHTFSDVAKQVIAARSKGWRTNVTTKRDASAAEWTRTLTVDCKPLAGRYIDEIEVEDVERVVQRFFDADQFPSLKKALNRIKTVFDYARAKQWRKTDNPASAAIFNHIFPVGNGATVHHATLAYKDMPDFMAKLRKVDNAITALALEMIILCAARPGEVLGMRWPEISFDDALWTIPAARMKAAREHQAPLSEPAVALLRKVERLRRRKDDYVFPSDNRAGRPLTNQSLWRTTRKLTEGKGTSHGFRSAFRDWAGDATSFPREVCEAALAHLVGSATELAYRRGSALEKRRELLAAWADYLDGKTATGKVVPFRKRDPR